MAIQLQRALQNLEKWEETGNGIQYCQIQCPKNWRRLEPFIFNYTLHGCCLEAIDTTKHLGVYLSKHLRWNNYMRNITNKENKALGFLRQNLKQCSSYAKEKTCKALARPTVEYSSSVWDCYTGKNIVQVEMVQRRAARWILSRYNRQDSVSDMLSCIEPEDIAISQNNFLPECLRFISSGLLGYFNEAIHRFITSHFVYLFNY